MTTTGRRVAVYARISRDKGGGGLGVGRQTADCADLADKLGWAVAGPPYVDNDLSAYTGKPRPAYRRLLGAIESGAVDTVITWHTDRLHRSPAELEQWITVCEPRGVEVHTVKAGPIDLATPAGRMVARQLGAVARYESEHRSERVAAAMDRIAANGGYLGGPRPFGWTTGGMALDPAEAELVRDGTRMILEGRSLRSVATAWNTAGSTTPRAARRWEPATVRDVLLRARNAGLLVHRGQIAGPGAWTPIVAAEHWRGAVAVLTNSARRTSPGPAPRWLGSGLYRCGIAGCGGPMVVGTSGQQRAPSYLCRGYRGRPGGRHVTRAAPTLDDYIARVIVTRLSQPDAVELLHPRAATVDTAALRADIAAIDAQRDELAAQLGRGEVSMSMLAAADGGFRSRRSALEARLDAATAAAGPAAMIAGQDDPAGAWAAQPPDVRRAVLDELMVVTVLPAPRGRRPDRSYFDPGSIDIVWREPT